MHKVGMRLYFSTYHLWAAKDFAKEASTIEAAHTGEAQFDIRHRALVMSSIIEAGAFLESVINELFKDCFDGYEVYLLGLSKSQIGLLGEQWARWHEKGRSAPPTLEKFDAALKCCCIESFGRDRTPYQDAKLGLLIRNALIHSTPESLFSGEGHRFDSLKSRFPSNSLMSGSGNAYFPDKCLGAGCAHWACLSMRAFADAFFEKLTVKPNYQSSHPF